MPQNDDITLYIYADDITVTCVGRDPQIIRHKMQQCINQLIVWSET